MRLHDAKILETSNSHNKMVEEIIYSTICMATQAHLWHWQTKSYSVHTALGNYYTFLRETVDQLAEVFMGMGGEIKNFSPKKINNFESIDVMKNRFKEYKTTLTETETELMKDKNTDYHAVGDIILSIIKETDKLLYLLTLE